MSILSSVARENKKSGGGAGTVTGANNGDSLNGANVVLGQNEGAVGDPGALTSNREIPGAFSIALPNNAAQLGVGLTNTQLALLSQMFAVFKTFAAGATAAGASYSQSSFAPAGAVVYTGLNAFSANAILDLSAGRYNPATAAADINGIVGGVLTNANDGNQNTGFISGIMGVILSTGNINVLDAAAVKAKSPRANSGGAGSVITNMYGVYIMDQSTLVGTVNHYGIFQAGTTDINSFAGLMRFVNLAGNGTGSIGVDNSGNLSWIPGGNLVLNTQAASYTLALTDRGKLVEMNNAAANNLTVPANATVAFPIGTSILVSQLGAGQTSILPDAGVTVRSAGGALNLASQYSMGTLVKRDTNEWYFSGDIAV